MATENENTNEENTSTETEQNTNAGEKKFTQDDLNKLIAKEKRDAQKKFELLQNEFTTLKTSIEEKERTEETKLKEKVDEMKKDAPQSIMKLLEKLTIQEQYEWLSDEENKIEKVDLPKTPKESGDGKPKYKSLGTFI